MLSKMEDINPYDDIPADQIDPEFRHVVEEYKVCENDNDNDALRPSNSRIGMSFAYFFHSPPSFTSSFLHLSTSFIYFILSTFFNPQLEVLVEE